MIVLTDTSPLNYLILIGAEDVLPKLFGRVIVPAAVAGELRHPGAPAKVRAWIDSPPPWMEVLSPSSKEQQLALGIGEAEAINLALELQADLLLMDDRVARREAEAKGLAVAGTIIILEAAAERGLVRLPEVITALCNTNFRISSKVLAAALTADAKRLKKLEE